MYLGLIAVVVFVSECPPAPSAPNAVSVLGKFPSLILQWLPTLSTIASTEILSYQCDIRREYDGAVVLRQITNASELQVI